MVFSNVVTHFDTRGTALHRHHLLTTAIALFALMNPITAIPIFLALTPGHGRHERRVIALQVGAVSAGTLLVAYFAGDAILGLFRIEMDAFRIAGALVIGYAAWGMVMGATGKLYEPTGTSPAVIPLSIPKTAGPGTIAAVVALGDTDIGVERLGDLLTIGVLGLVTVGLLLAAEPIERRVGEQGLMIVSRIFGLLLLAIAASSIMTSLRDFFPGLR